ncbi:MAG: cellulose biosynthesis protein BcsS [Xanthobacteraceae bacterium]
MNKLNLTGMATAAFLVSVGFAGAADAPVPMPVKAAPPPTGPAAVYFGGAAFSPHSWFADIGAVWAFNRNLNTDGALLRIRGGTGEYDYIVSPALGEASVDFHVAEVMVGYQRFINGVRYSGYIGAQVQSHDNNLDPVGLDGTKWGVTAQGEVFAPFGNQGYGLLLGQISSVHSSYFVMGKLGWYVAPNLSVGPEVAALGNKRFDAARAGLFASLNFSPAAQIVLSGGYNWDDGNAFRDNDGAYGTIHVRLLH